MNFKFYFNKINTIFKRPSNLEFFSLFVLFKVLRFPILSESWLSFVFFFFFFFFLIIIIIIIIFYEAYLLDCTLLLCYICSQQSSLFFITNVHHGT